MCEERHVVLTTLQQTIQNSLPVYITASLTDRIYQAITRKEQVRGKLNKRKRSTRKKALTLATQWFYTNLQAQEEMNMH